jgi:UPF0755 protein
MTTSVFHLWQDLFLKTFLQTLFFLFIIFICGLVGLSFFLNRSTGKIPPAGEGFEIKKGDNSHTIAGRLHSLGYINSEQFFIGIIKILGVDSKIRTGWIMLDSDSTSLNIIESIARNKYITVTFTVPEGSTLEQIKEILVKDRIVSKNDLDDFFSTSDYKKILGLEKYATIEGFLYPETYKFYKGVEPADIFLSMKNLFFKKLLEIYPGYDRLNEKELYKKIILASIVEREVKNKDEAPVVAQVFYNRLRTGMKLQSCATVQYVLGKPKEHLLDSDLLVDNPYNTYLYSGLPPAPISNPGFNSLKAAFIPDNNDYLFFVVKDPEKGTHFFSKTYSEHLKAQKIYKELKGFY